MTVEIRKNKLGYNGFCTRCGKDQPGHMPQPFIVWYKGDTEKRGHNDPACSKECAEKLAELYKSL